MTKMIQGLGRLQYYERLKKINLHSSDANGEELLLNLITGNLDNVGTYSEYKR